MKKKNRVKARQDIGCEFGLRPNLLLTSLPPSFVLSFRARSLTFLPTLGNSRFSDGNRNSIVYPRFMKKKLPARLSAISPENPKYITYFVVLDFPSVALRAHFSPPLLSSPETSISAGDPLLGRVFRSSKARSSGDR